MYPAHLAVIMLQSYCKSMPCKFHLDVKAGFFFRLAQIFHTVKAVTMEPSHRANMKISSVEVKNVE